MIRLRIFFFFCLLFLTSAACARAITPGVLVVGIEDNRPPYQFMNNGQADGFCVDLLKDMSKSMGVKLAYVSGSLEALSEYVSTGQIDLLAGYAYSAARDKKIDFSIPQRRVEFVLFVRDDSMTHSIEMLQGKIALKSNSVMVESLKGKFQLMLVKDYTEAFRLLADGNCQGVVATEVEGLYLINHLHLLHIKKASNEVLLDVDYCFGVKDGNIELLRRINLAFEKLKDSGRFEQIYEKWFSTLRTQSLWEIILPYFVSLAVVICLLLGIMLWSWILERQVRAKTIEIKKINESLFLYGNLIKFSGDGVYRYTFDEGKILFANDGLAKILDLDVPGQKLEGQLLKNVLVYTEDSGSVRRAANKKGEIYNLEYHFKTTKGDDRWVVHNSIVTHDAITGVKFGV